MSSIGSSKLRRMTLRMQRREEKGYFCETVRGDQRE
jgi:hypothetical protein